MIWILLSLNSALFFGLRYILIKKYFSNTDSYLVAFIARFSGVLFLLPLLFYYPLVLPGLKFWGVLIITSIFTAIASILQIKAVQKFEVSNSVPFLAFIPLFMLFWVWIIFNETPKPLTIPGIILLSGGAIVLNFQRNQSLKSFFKTMFANKGGLAFLAVAFIFGFTTTMDRIAIDAVDNGGFIYTFYWHVFSTLLFSFIFFVPKRRTENMKTIKLDFKPLLLFGICGIVAFFSQMYAVEIAKGVSANVIYIKALTLLQLLVASLISIPLFKEKDGLKRVIGALLMICGAGVIILSIRG